MNTTDPTADLVTAAAHGVLTIKLNRPERRNALSRALLSSLREQIRAAAADTEARCIVLGGNGPVFCAGADLVEARNANVVEHRAWTNEAAGLFEELRACPKPTIAAVHGAAVGAGGILAMLCDHVIFSRAATLRFPEVEHGLVPAVSLVHLQRLVGRRRAVDLLLMCQHLPADDAVAWGLASVAVEPEEFDQRLAIDAKHLASLAPGPVRTVKRLAGALAGAGDAAAETAAADAVLIRRLQFAKEHAS